MTKEVVISSSYDGKSLARLTRLKWLVAALLAVALMLVWMARKPVQTTEVTDTIDFGSAAVGGSEGASATGRPLPSEAAKAPVGARPAAGPAKAAASTPAGETAPPARAVADGPSLELERRVDGRFLVRGQALDAATRDQWINAIRIGAQGSRVDAELDLLEDADAPPAPWELRLRQLTALAADRRLGRVTLAGNRIVLEGPAVASSYRQDTERMFLAQLPEGFDIQYRIVNPSTGGARAATGKSAAADQVAAATSASASTGSTASTVAAAPVSEARPAANERAPSVPAGCPAQLEALAGSIYFRTDSVGIGRDDRRRLATLGRCMGSLQVSVIGFADSRHTSQYNLDLSKRRAQAVADLIRSEAPRNAVIRVSAQGAERTGKTRADAERSRRVEIRLR